MGRGRAPAGSIAQSRTARDAARAAGAFGRGVAIAAGAGAAVPAVARRGVALPRDRRDSRRRDLDSGRIFTAGAAQFDQDQAAPKGILFVAAETKTKSGQTTCTSLDKSNLE